MFDSMLANTRIRAEIQEKEREENRVAKMAEKLMTYMIEIANLLYLAKRLRYEEARLEEIVCRLEKEAHRAERRAIVAGIEALQLEEEIQEYENRM